MKKRLIPAFILPVLIFAGCASTVRIQVARTPTLNTAGIRRISVMPFGASYGNAVSLETALYVTSAATNRIMSLNHFTLVDPFIIEHLLNNNENIEGHVDALFTGQITRTDSKESTSQYQRTDKDGNTYTVIMYTREVEMEFNYYFTRVRDGTLIGPVFKKGTASSSSENWYELQSAADLLRTVADTQLRYLHQDIAPYVVIENRRLESERSNNKELKARMKDASTQVRSGSYRIALESYLGIYEEYKNFAAAKNASILYEALGYTQTAANFMSAVFNETGNMQAAQELARLNRILRDQATIAAEYQDARSQTERVAAHASNEIQKILPANAKVWVYNNSINNVMADAIVDNITAGLLNRGVDIVDRDNLALIEAEQLFQMSGYVSDNDFVSIGNTAGANVIVIAAVTGTGDMRRLQLRVLDIERGVPILQSDTGSAWRL